MATLLSPSVRVLVKCTQMNECGLRSDAVQVEKKARAELQTMVSWSVLQREGARKGRTRRADKACDTPRID